MALALDIGTIGTALSGTTGAVGEAPALNMGSIGLGVSGTAGATGSVTLDTGAVSLLLSGSTGGVGGLALDIGAVKFDATGSARVMGTLGLDLGDIGFLANRSPVSGVLKLDLGIVGFLAASSPPATGRMALDIGEIVFTTAGYVRIMTTAGQALLVNLNTGGHARYSNYQFDFYLRLGNTYYGGNETGLYRLEGDTDAGTLINAAITTAEIDFAGKVYIQDMHLSARLENSGLTITTNTNERDDSPEYQLLPDSQAGLHSRRVRFAKGRSGAAWQFVVGNDGGGDFDLQSIAITPIRTTRTR